ncbi:MAG TPA: tripartite tricarboxylate transporter substrate-binding protein, partial [Beijerinckiaceae bacterium]|nr:tripartite tricarboxylate transporter substrate-binding protein [Beijerinckiaceae bacterium]
MTALAALSLLSLAVNDAAQAQGAADFFRGKEITIGIPSDAGGGYDATGRLIAQYLPKYIPGNPRIIPQNNPAGGGLVLVNLLYNTAPKDGTYIGIIRGSALYEEIFNNPAVKFESLKLNWLGNFSRTQDGCVFSQNSGVSSPQDLFKREITIGASGVGAQAYSLPKIYNDLLGTKFKIIVGYKGSGDRVLAMERGELEGACGITTGTLRSSFAGPVKEGKIKIVAQAGLSKDEALPDVPNILDLAKTAEQRRALEFLFAQLDLGRAVAAPPGVPAERVKILREAFEQMLKDPGLAADVKRMQLDFDPMSAAATIEMIEHFFATPKPIVEQIRVALTAKK